MALVVTDSKYRRKILCDDGCWWTAAELCEFHDYLTTSMMSNRITKDGIYKYNIFRPATKLGYNGDGTKKNPGISLRDSREARRGLDGEIVHNKKSGAFASLSTESRAHRILDIPVGTCDDIIKCPTADYKNYKDYVPKVVLDTPPTYRKNIQALQRFNAKHTSLASDTWLGGM